MSLPTQGTWVWAISRRWWRTGSLVCCSLRGHKQLDTTEWLNNNKLLIYDWKNNSWKTRKREFLQPDKDHLLIQYFILQNIIQYFILPNKVKTNKQTKENKKFLLLIPYKLWYIVCFLLKIGNKAIMSAIAAFIQYYTEGPTKYNKTRQRI